jgi:hypothetical protein
MAAVETAIERGSFDYRAHFPRGSRLHVLYPNDRIRDGAVIPSTITLQDGTRIDRRSLRTVESFRTQTFTHRPGFMMRRLCAAGSFPHFGISGYRK